MICTPCSLKTSSTFWCSAEYLWSMPSALALAALCLIGSRWLFQRGLRRYSGASA